jgi:hypothetical protein
MPGPSLRPADGARGRRRAGVLPPRAGGAAATSSSCGRTGLADVRVLGVLLGLLASAGAVWALLGLGGPSVPETPAAIAHDVARPQAPPPPLEGALRERIEAAIHRGVAHLLATQNKSGSWGTPASNLWDIYAPGPGSYYAFEAAVTGLAVSALVETGGDDPKAADAVRRGTDWLLAHHTRARRVSEDVLYNVWAHAYVLEAFARLLARERDPARRAALAKGASECVDLLSRFEYVDGGWGYYNFDITAQHPGHGSTSFTTATALVALRMAADQGVPVPAPLVRRALAFLDISRKPDWAFAYSWDHRYYPQGGINKIKGSLARTPACMLALERWGRDVPASFAEGMFQHLEDYGHFLLIARKYPRPHESWYQNSGYFCFYGFYYATWMLDLVPAAVRAEHRVRLAETLLPLQEKDGSWWDYQLYSYHKPYGTSYVLMSLARCLR